MSSAYKSNYFYGRREGKEDLIRVIFDSSVVTSVIRCYEFVVYE